MEKAPILKTIGIALLAASAALAAPIDLVGNGEFEGAVITAHGGDFQRFDEPLSVPFWTDDDPEVGIELWRQGFRGSPRLPYSPTLGSDGNPTGQHMELIARNSGTIISQSFLVPVLVSAQAVFQFDAWQRGANNSATYSVVGSLSGTLVNQAAIILSTTAWVQNQQILAVTPGELITISFAGLGASDRSAHVDQVEFIVDGHLPEPSSLLLLGGGLIGLLLARRRIARPGLESEFDDRTG